MGMAIQADWPCHPASSSNGLLARVDDHRIGRSATCRLKGG